MTSIDTPAQASHGRRLRVLSVAVGAAVLAGLVALGVTYRHPTAFPSYGGWSMKARPLPLGTTAYVTVTEAGEARRTVVIHGASPHGLAGSTKARFDFVVCTLRPGPDLMGVWTSAQIHTSCRTLVPAAGATLGRSRQQLLVAVTPTGPGTVVLHGIDLRYAAGWRSGTQHIGGEVTIPVSTSP